MQIAMVPDFKPIGSEIGVQQQLHIKPDYMRWS
jgi:hypothetical protein